MELLTAEPWLQRVLIKDASTNTEFDFEKELLRREHEVVHREQEVLAKEKELFTTESAFFAKEKEFAAQSIKLQDELSTATARAARAETAAMESANQLLHKEQDLLRSHAASAAADELRLQEHIQHQALLETQLAELKEAHRRELEQLKTIEENLLRTIEIAQDENKELHRLMQEKESDIRIKEAALVRGEAKMSELTASLERAASEQRTTTQRLSSEAQSNKDRLDQAEKRNAQLENQVKELKANVETVYNKCIEKDDDIYRLKRALLSKSEDMEDMKVQHAKATERIEKMARQQSDLYRQRLETSIAQMEMEFRKEHYHSMNKLQVVQKKHQEASRDTVRLKDAYQLSLKREADAQQEISKLQALLADDKRRVFVEDAQRADNYRLSLESLKSEIVDLKAQLETAREKSGTLETIEAVAEELRLTNDQLRAETMRQASEIETLKVLEGDLRAAIKVKDVMIEHEQAQAASMRKDRDSVEQQLQDEIAELHNQVDDLEMALDENIQKEQSYEKELERTLAHLHEKERAVDVKAQEIDDLAHELGKKHGALELIETEMERLRASLDDQNGIFQRRLERHLEQHREELERVKAGAEDSRELLRIQWEAERREMIQRYASVSSDLKDVAAQNAKLRVSVEAERKRNAQCDQEMRVLLAQVGSEGYHLRVTEFRRAHLLCVMCADRSRAASEEGKSQAHQVSLRPAPAGVTVTCPSACSI